MNVHADRSFLTTVAGAALGLGLLFMIQAYFGIDHDSVLYLGEALRLRLPGILDHDLFFQYGSQGRYTVFPHVVAILLSTGAAASTLFMVGTILGLLLFAGASWLALRALLPAGQRWLPWLTLLCLPTAYGAYRIFGYAEPFFTPRVYAESLCLIALALLTRQHLRAAAACLLAAVLLHPLQALGALLVFWLWLVLSDRRWLHALWLLPIPFALGLFGIAPFDGLLHALDRTTYKLAYQFSRHLFVGGWRAEDFQTLTFDLLMLLLAARTQSAPLRRWSLAAAIAMPLALATSYVLADLLRLALPAGLQLWRAHWLAHWLAMAFVGIAIQRDLTARDIPRLLLLVLTVTLAYGRPGWAWMPFGLLYASWPWLQPRLRPALQKLVGAGCLLAVLLFFLDYIAGVHAEFVKAHWQLAQVPFDRAFFTFPALTLALAVAATALWRRASHAGRFILMVVLLAFCAYAGLRWDARPTLYKALEAHPFQPTLFGVELPERAQVYWERASSVANWLVINRADYYSPQQLSGLVFSPGAAQDALARMDRLRSLRQEAQKCVDPLMSQIESGTTPPCQISAAALRTACAPGTKTAPAPDYMILPYRQPQPALGQWTVKLGLLEEPTRTYYLYSCHDLR